MSIDDLVSAISDQKIKSVAVESLGSVETINRLSITFENGISMILIATEDIWIEASLVKEIKIKRE